MYAFMDHKGRYGRKLTVSVILLLVLALAWVHLQTGFAFGNQTMRYGSRGGDVYELQGRLQYLGYYNGLIDGVFGWQTERAVMDFQYKFGMKVDGIAGPDTKSRLVRATPGWHAGGTAGAGTAARTSRFSTNDMDLLARAVYSEARGEPYEGQVAIAAVILNRVSHDNFPNTVAGVIFEPRAFTAVADGQFWLEPNEQAKKAVRDAINGWDPTGGAIYYFNPNTATSGWIWSRPQIKQIGKHIFCM